MPSGRCRRLDDLPPAARRILDEARRGVLATIDERGRPHAVPVCYVVRANQIVTPLDEKPKSGRLPARRRNVERSSAATFLVDRWSEDWTRLGWVMVRGPARLEPLGRAGDLVRRYEQYREVAPGTEAIVIEADDAAWWLWQAPGHTH